MHDNARKMYAEPGSGAAAILKTLASRFSCREFDGSPIDRALLTEIVHDGLEAPSSCNHQNWHFVVVTDPATKRRAREISGGNHHFEFASALIYLCFQKGFTHDRFSIVQSVAAACYHMMISAHLRGFASIWNAGIGDVDGVADMLGVPPTFEIQGALCIGRPTAAAPQIKAPRRPPGEVVSFGRFNRPAHAIYPAKPAEAYPFFKISNAHNPFAEWRPAVWGWDRIADFRGYAVWAKSPTAGVYRSRRQGDATAVETDLAHPLSPGESVVDVMGWGGTHTAALAARLPEDARLHIADLSEGNLRFMAERLRAEGQSRVESLLMKGPRIPMPDSSADLVTVFQQLEHTPEPTALLDEIARILKRGGRAVVTARNMDSAFGAHYRTEMVKAQVPNQGPFEPLPARDLRQMLAERFEITYETGISQEVAGGATVVGGEARFACPLYAAAMRKRA